MLIHLQEEFLALLLNGQGTCVAVESSQTSTVTVLHLREIHQDRTTALGPFHTLCQRVGGEIEGFHYTVGLQTEESRTLRQTPRCIDGVVVPLPVQTEFRIGEVIALHDGGLRLSAYERTHLIGHLTVFVAQHRPTVNPTTRHHREYTTHATTVLEDDTIPVARGGIDNRSLGLVRESTEFAL